METHPNCVISHTDFDKLFVKKQYMKYVLIYLIKIYQNIPGSWHNNCKFQPTCSNYAIGVLTEFGLIKGLYLTIKRIINKRKVESN